MALRTSSLGVPSAMVTLRAHVPGDAVVGEGFLLHVELARVRRRDDLDDREIVVLGERVIALVVCRDGHDRAGAVGADDVVGDEDGDLVAVDRVDRERAERDAGLGLASRRSDRCRSCSWPPST